MKSFLNRKVALGATGLILLVGAAGAVAATQSSQGSAKSERQAEVADVAKHLGVTPSALTAAMKAAMVDRINAAVAAGRLTQDQATKLKQRVESGNGAPFLGGRGFGHAGLRGGFGHRGLARAGAVVTQYLGISEATLRSDLQSGKSLAQIASSTPGKSAAGLKAALMTAAKTRLDKAVASKRITTAQEQRLLASLPARIDRALQRTGLGPMPGARGPGSWAPSHP